jgi:hypothetical protein
VVRAITRAEPGVVRVVASRARARLEREKVTPGTEFAEAREWHLAHESQRAREWRLEQGPESEGNPLELSPEW